MCVLEANEKQVFAEYSGFFHHVKQVSLILKTKTAVTKMLVEESEMCFHRNGEFCIIVMGKD